MKAGKKRQRGYKAQSSAASRDPRPFSDDAVTSVGNNGFATSLQFVCTLVLVSAPGVPSLVSAAVAGGELAALQVYLCLHNAQRSMPPDLSPPVLPELLARAPR